MHQTVSLKINKFCNLPMWSFINLNTTELKKEINISCLMIKQLLNRELRFFYILYLSVMFNFLVKKYKKAKPKSTNQK